MIANGEQMTEVDDGGQPPFSDEAMNILELEDKVKGLAQSKSDLGRRIAEYALKEAE